MNETINFTSFEKEVIGKYTNFFNSKLKEKELNPDYLDPRTMIFMNDGYVEIDENGYPFDFVESKTFMSDKKNINFKYQVNLYKRLLDFAGIKNNESVEVLVDVGCGKGGGVSFYKDFYKFKTCIGIDLTEINISIAKSHSKNVDFRIASATNLPIEDKTVDVITCVESLMYYFPFHKFVEEAYRVLKTNGKLLISVPLNEQQENNLESIFINNGFMLSNKEDITENVRMACAISKNRFREISLQESEMMGVDEKRYFDKITFYKNFIFIKK